MLTTRLIQKEDIETLAEVYTDVYKSLDIGEHWEKSSAMKMLTYWFEQQPDLAYLAEYEGKIVGAFLVAVKPWWDGNQLFDGEIFTHPDFHGKGIGTALLKKVLTESKNIYDAKFWYAFTYTGSEHPLSWYKKVGFKVPDQYVMFQGSISEVLKNLEK